MKNAQSIISHLKQDPSLKNLQKTESYKKLLSLLPGNLSKAVRFMYNKNQVLFFVLDHPGYKMEFHYKLSLIKGLLKQLIIMDPSCVCIDADEIKTFVTNKPPLHVKTSPHLTGPFYDEASLAAFQNKAKDPEINALFEAIRQTIVCSKKP